MIALKAEGLATSKPAIGIMTSAVLDDIASLALVAIMVPVAAGEAEPTAQGILWTPASASWPPAQGRHPLPLLLLLASFSLAQFGAHSAEDSADYGRQLPLQLSAAPRLAVRAHLAF